MNEKEALHYMIDNPGKVVVGPWGYKYRFREGLDALIFEVGQDAPWKWKIRLSLPFGSTYRVEEEEGDINHLCNVVAEYIHAPQADRELDRIAVTRGQLNDLAAAILRKVERMIEDKAGER